MHSLTLQPLIFYEPFHFKNKNPLLFCVVLSCITTLMPKGILAERNTLMLEKVLFFPEERFYMKKINLDLESQKTTDHHLLPRLLCKYFCISLVKISPKNMQPCYKTKSNSLPLNQLKHVSACGQGNGNVLYTHIHLCC